MFIKASVYECDDQYFRARDPGLTASWLVVKATLEIDRSDDGMR